LAAALLLAEGAGKGDMAVPGLLPATAGMGWGLEDPMASHKLSSMVSRAQTSEAQRFPKVFKIYQIQRHLQHPNTLDAPDTYLCILILI